MARRKIPEGKPEVARRGVRGVPEAAAVSAPLPAAKRRALFELNAEFVDKNLQSLAKLDDTTRKRLCSLGASATAERSKIVHEALAKFNIFSPEKMGLFSEALNNLVLADNISDVSKAHIKRTTAGRGLTVPEKKIVEKIYQTLSGNGGFRMPLERFDLKIYVPDPGKRTEIINAVVKQFKVDRRELIINALCLKTLGAPHAFSGLEQKEIGFINKFTSGY